jgi:site-specific recombinase XerD
MTTRSLSRIVKNSFINTGLNSNKLTAHSLRHTAITLSLLGGASLQEAQAFAGHTNITTTQIYAHNIERANNKCEATIANAIFE